MLYDVNQVAELIKVSKVTVYAKLKLKEMVPYIVKKQGKTFIDEDGLSLIKELISFKTDLNDDEEIAATDEIRSEVKYLTEELIATLKDDVEFLRKEIEVKNDQLESKDKLLENMQVLLKQKEDQRLLEEHFSELDKKLIDLKTELRVKNAESKAEPEKKSIFGFFARKK